MAELTDEQILMYQEQSELAGRLAQAMPDLEKYVFTPLEMAAFSKWAKTFSSETEVAEQLMRIKLGVDEVRNHIKKIIDTGNNAKHQLTYSTRKDEEYA